MNGREEEKDSLLSKLVKFAWSMLSFLASLTGTQLPEGRRKRARKPPERKPRSADREVETQSQVEWRERWGTAFVLLTFAAAVVGGVGFVVSYWTGAGTQALGLSLAIFFGGVGMTLVVWARWLMVQKEAEEPREPMPSAPEQRERVEEAFCGGAHDVRRRRMLKWMSFGFAAMLGSIVASMLRSLGVSPWTKLTTPVWQGGQRLVTEDGKPVSLDTLKPGSTVTVFPEDKIGSERAQTVLIRVREDLLQLPSDRSNWAPKGYLAYSRVCTHAGCPVGEFEANTSILLCPCHQSSFDVLRGATPTAGPAARALPQLPLYADANGDLRAGGGFSSPPGPGFWGMS